MLSGPIFFKKYLSAKRWWSRQLHRQIRRALLGGSSHHGSPSLCADAGGSASQVMASHERQVRMYHSLADENPADCLAGLRSHTVPASALSRGLTGVGTVAGRSTASSSRSTSSSSSSSCPSDVVHKTGKTMSRQNPPARQDHDRYENPDPQEAGITGTALTIGVVSALCYAVASVVSFSSSSSSSKSAKRSSSAGDDRSARGGKNTEVPADSTSPRISPLPLANPEDDPENYDFVAKGSMHFVYRLKQDIKGRDATSSNTVLRVRKNSQQQAFYDEEFRRRVVRSLFPDCNVQVPEIVLASPEFLTRLVERTRAADSATFSVEDGTTAKSSTNSGSLASSSSSKNGDDLIPVSKLRDATRTSALRNTKSTSVLTIEIKPKCGLQEIETLPTRFEMLQYQKLRNGEISRITRYNPVQMFKPRTAARALQNLFDEPQNFLKVFLDGKLLFGEELLRGSPTDNTELDSNLHDNLIVDLAREAGKALKISGAGEGSTASGLPSAKSEFLLDLVQQVVQADPAWQRILHVQAFAAGRTAEYANELLEHLQRTKTSTRNMILSVDDYAAALQASKFRPFLPDESGMRLSEREGRKLVEQTKRSEFLPGERQFSQASQTDLEKQIVAYICRFLLGRMAMDLSVMMNFVHADVENLEPLRKAGFRPLRGQIWYRLTLVDTDSKPLDRLPTYSRQLAEYERLWKGMPGGG
ncbi:unnamed protein product [Amoebophrya sp. A120]|nr:unnamed protein product [Amoebophrya sp. A120]|eukprot:GSA120T00017264001.1